MTRCGPSIKTDSAPIESQDRASGTVEHRTHKRYRADGIRVMQQTRVLVTLDKDHEHLLSKLKNANY